MKHYKMEVLDLRHDEVLSILEQDRMYMDSKTFKLWVRHMCYDAWGDHKHLMGIFYVNDRIWCFVTLYNDLVFEPVFAVESHIRLDRVRQDRPGHFIRNELELRRFYNNASIWELLP